MVLGGTGLVGLAVARELLPLKPRTLVLTGLTADEVEHALDDLREEADAAGVPLRGEWGDVFLPYEWRDAGRAALLADPAARARFLDDLYSATAEASVEESTLGVLLQRHRPAVVVDAINTATAFAYQNVFASAAELRRQAARGALDLDAVERHLALLYLPQLIRHVQLLLESARRAGTRLYVKIGTSGTGGMGLNIPFTHSEERPSRMLLAKAALAGAHSLLLYLMARTPGAPAVKEVKPVAAISWKRLGRGPILRRGRPVPLVDAVRPAPLGEAFAEPVPGALWTDLGEPLRGVFLDAGENGLFSPPEFETLTALGLMEFVTPEEIARTVVAEILGHPTGHDIVAALDAAGLGPTYRAGVLREAALSALEALAAEDGAPSVAYEMLGPPRLSKLLFEAEALRRAAGSLEAALAFTPEGLAAAVAARFDQDAALRRAALSVGLPILRADGTILRGPEVSVPPDSDLDRTAARGWIDLRPANWAHWLERLRAIRELLRREPPMERGSRSDLGPAERQRLEALRPGALAAWIFCVEDGGERRKR